MTKVNFEEPLKFLNCVGVHPSVDNTFSICRKILSAIFFFGAAILSVCEVLFNFHGLETCARASESMIVQYQVSLKFTILLIYKKEIIQLLEETSHFWTLDNFGSKMETKFERIHILLGKFFSVYKLLMILMSVQWAAVKLILRSDKPLAIAYGEYNGLTPSVDHFYFILHTAGLLVILGIVVGFDGLFFYFIGHVLSELAMVKTAFRIITHNSREGMRNVLEHHQFILRFIGKLNNVYSTMLLHQHLTCLFGICFGLFLMSKDGIPPDFGHLTKFVPFIASFVTQTFTFCFIASLVNDWSLDISNAVFYSGWDENKISLYKFEKVIAIIRSQRAAKLTLGGFGVLDLESFSLVVKNSFSFFTFINTMNEK